MDLDLETAGRANLRAALEMSRGVAVAGEVSPAQLESCADAAELVTKALGGLPTVTLTPNPNAVRKPSLAVHM